MSKPSLSATLIVRNEAAVLGDCLTSIKPIVDEIIVVDTGSTDRSPEIAADLGASVFHFAWIDDFAAARNHAIDQARGDWLLYIDADERVRAYDPAVLAEDLAAADLLAATVEFRPRTGYTAYREMRLIRRDPRIRFRGAIHETFRGAIARLEADGLGRVGESNLGIDHVGYDGDQAHKLDRNFRLLTVQIAADPARVYLHWHLGTVYRSLRRIADAEASWLAGMEIVRARTERQPEDLLCLVELIKLRWARGLDTEALIAEGEALQPGNFMLVWLRAKTVCPNDYAASVELFRRLAEVDAARLVDEVSYDSRIFGAHAWAEMGSLAFRHGRFADSAEWFGQASALAPGSQEFSVKRHLAAARAGR